MNRVCVCAVRACNIDPSWQLQLGPALAFIEQRNQQQVLAVIAVVDYLRLLLLLLQLSRRHHIVFLYRSTARIYAMTKKFPIWRRYQTSVAQRSADDMLQSRTSDLKDEGHFHPFAAAAAVHSIDDDNNNNNNKTWII